MTDAELREAWNDAVTAFLLTPPSDPRCPELFQKANELDKQCRAAGVL